MEQFKQLDRVTAIERQYFAVRFREARMSLGLSQDAITAISGVQQRYISSVERGRANVGIDVLSLLSKSVNKELFELLKPIKIDI